MCRYDLIPIFFIQFHLLSMLANRQLLTNEQTPISSSSPVAYGRLKSKKRQIFFRHLLARVDYVVLHNMHGGQLRMAQ